MRARPTLGCLLGPRAASWGSSTSALRQVSALLLSGTQQRPVPRPLWLEFVFICVIFIRKPAPDPSGRPELLQMGLGFGYTYLKKPVEVAGHSYQGKSESL